MTYHVSLNNFTTRNQLNQIIAENMVDVKLFQEGHDDFEEIAVFCFTKAYEICDKICKSLPNIWKIPDYYKLARYPSTDIDFVTKIQAVTMSIVCIFTDHFPKGWRDSNKLFLEKLKDSIYHMYVKGENEELMEVTQAIYPSVCVKTFKALRRRTNIDLELSFGDFFLPEYINASVEDAIQKRIDKIPVPKYTVSGSVLSIDTISFKEYETKTKRKAEGEPINIAELQERVAYLNKENSELKAQLAQQQERNKIFEEQTKTIQEQKEEIARLKEELNATQLDEQNKIELNRLLAENEELALAVQSYKDQGKGLTAPEAAILITAICLEMNQIPANGREGLAPIIEFCWGKSSSTSSEALRRKVTNDSVEKLARKFDSLTPKLARIIRELPQKLEERNNERLMHINPKVNK